MRKWILQVLGRTLIGLALLLGASGGALGQPLLGVVEQFQKIQHHGDALAFRLGVGDDPYGWTTYAYCKHYQGLARMDVDEIPYFFLTRSGSHTTWGCPNASDNPGEVLVVQMMSRGNDGERLRSNRLDPEIIRFNETPPPEEDIGVAHIHFSDEVGGGETAPPGWLHPGGLQIADGVLVIAMQEYCGDGFTFDPRGVGAYDCIGETDETAAGLMFLDVSDPLSPQILEDIDLKTLPPPLPGNLAGGYGSVAVIQEPSGTYLLATMKGRTDPLDFWRSTTTDLRDPALSVEWIGSWNPSDLDPNDAGWSGWQTINFIRDADGTLYLLGTDNTDIREPIIVGQDWIRLFRVTPSGEAYALEYAGADQSHSERRLLTEYPQTGNFKAASGVYVSPTGQLIVYSGHHDRYIHYDVKYVPMGEFRNIDVHVSTTDAGFPPQLEEADVDGDGITETSCSGWVELYDEIWGWDANASPLRTLIFDYRDRHLEDWNNLTHYNPTFNDKASAMRWNLPPGQVAYLFEAANYDDGWRNYWVTGTGNEPDFPSLGWLQDNISGVWLSPVADAGGGYDGEVGAPIVLSRANPCYVDGADDELLGQLVFQWEFSGAEPCTISDAAAIRPSVTCTEAGVYEILLTVPGSAANDSATLYIGVTPIPSIAPGGLALLAGLVLGIVAWARRGN